MFCFQKIVYRAIITAFVLFAFQTVASAADSAPWPWMEKDLVLHIATGENNPRNSEGDFVILDDGTILCVYTHFLGNSGADHATACLMSRSSSDGGQSWTTEDKLELENEGNCNIMCVTLRRLADGRVAIFYGVKESPSDCRPYMRIRQSDGTWGERLCLITEPSYNTVNNDRTIQLSSGRILVPVGRATFLGRNGNDYDYDLNCKCFCVISDDGGKTWREGESVEPTDGVFYQEPGLCELADGRLLMNIRTNDGVQYFAFSEDGGQTWGKPFKSCLDSPLSPTLIKRIPGSDELLAVGNSLRSDHATMTIDRIFTGRTTMTIERLVPDASEILVRKTMEHSEKQDAPDWQYPAICFLDDNTALVAYFSWTEGAFVYKIKLSDL